MSTAIATTTTTIRHRDLAIMGQILLAGYQRHSLPSNCESLVALLRAGVVTAPDLLPAMADDVSLAFGVRVDRVAVMGYTSHVVALAFDATVVAGGQARAMASGDPVWLLWPGGFYEDDPRSSLMFFLGQGVARMLNRQWPQAVNELHQAGEETAGLCRQDIPLVRRAIAANLNLAVSYSHGEIPRLATLRGFKCHRTTFSLVPSAMGRSSVIVTPRCRRAAARQ